MKKYKFTIIILTIICLHTNLFADIAPNPIKAKSISPKDQTSIRMESERVIIDLYNDSSVVKCLFHMKNLGKKEKLQIGFPEMSFHYFRQISTVDEASRFQVKENGKAVNFHFSNFLRSNEENRKNVGSYQIREDWYLWESEFRQGESKTIEVQYSMPFGARYKTDERFFTYLLSTGAQWKGTIGKAEVVVNLKDIERDSLISQQPNNCVISNDQLTWTFSDLEPTTNDDIKINYNSNKILYKGKKPVPPVFIVNGNLMKEWDAKSMEPNNIANFEIIRNPEETKKYTSQNNGVVKIYTKDFVLTELKRLIKAKSKEEIVLPDYDQLKENYRLFINTKEVDFAKITGINFNSVATLEITDLKEGQNKIMIELEK
jgi:hypothetical protein